MWLVRSFQRPARAEEDAGSVAGRPALPRALVSEREERAEAAASDRVGLIHANDSLFPRGERRDRDERQRKPTQQ